MNPLPTLAEAEEHDIFEQVACLKDQGFPTGMLVC